VIPLALLDMLGAQRRTQKTGDIRTGKYVPPANGKRGYPTAIDTFRFTTQSPNAAEAVAGLFGGTVAPWEHNDRNRGLEVITDTTVLNVLVPPYDNVIVQWYEWWTKGGLQHRCDSQFDMKTQSTCICPHAEDPTNADECRTAGIRRAELAKQGKACHAITRTYLQLPELPDIGVWRITTGSFYAAGEMADKARMLKIARDAGVFLPAVIRLEPRQIVEDGETKNFNVPVLELLDSMLTLSSGRLEPGINAGIQRLTAGTTTLALGTARQLALAPGTGAPAESVMPPAVPPADAPPAQPAEPNRTAGSKAATEPSPLTAQEIADLAANAETWKQVEVLIKRAIRLDCADVYIHEPGTDPEVHSQLRDYLTARHAELAQAAG
jgi:Recombination directionality factor-like